MRSIYRGFDLNEVAVSHVVETIAHGRQAEIDALKTLDWLHPTDIPVPGKPEQHPMIAGNNLGYHLGFETLVAL